MVRRSIGRLGTFVQVIVPVRVRVPVGPPKSYGFPGLLLFPFSRTLFVRFPVRPRLPGGPTILFNIFRLGTYSP